MDPDNTTRHEIQRIRGRGCEGRPVWGEPGGDPGRRRVAGTGGRGSTTTLLQLTLCAVTSQLTNIHFRKQKSWVRMGNQYQQALAQSCPTRATRHRGKHLYPKVLLAGPGTSSSTRLRSTPAAPFLGGSKWCLRGSIGYREGRSNRQRPCSM